MSEPTLRLRMFAGPNGSGKSTIKSLVRPDILGVYVNPDQIEVSIRQSGTLDLQPFGIKANSPEVRDFFARSTLLLTTALADSVLGITVADEKIDFRSVSINSYWASVAADFIRKKLLDSRIAFSFETVMSSLDKINLMQRARDAGYRTYLYYIATEDPLINISRVRLRVQSGGHGVPEDKIVSRYYRSLGLLHEAIRHSHRAYLFDNSGHQHVWVAEITDGTLLEMKTDQMPRWFKSNVWDKMHAE